MKLLNVHLFIFIFVLANSFIFSQSVYNTQRGQRGYSPMPRYDNTPYVSALDVYEELNKILPKSTIEFNLDEFEVQILKGYLIYKFENHNLIVENEDYSREERQKNLKSLEVQFLKFLATILEPEEIIRFVDMDFEYTKEERKKRKKNKKRNKS